MNPAPEPPAPSSTRRELDRSLATGLAWTGLGKWTTQLLSWVSTLVVARLLTPSDYGILGMATVYLGLVQLVSEFGLGTALIQRRDLDASQVSRLGGLSVLIGVGLFLVSAAAAPAIAGFFRERAVRLVLTVLATTFVITAFQIVPNALLARDMAFRRLALIDAMEALSQVVVTLTLAILGARYWALVFGVVASKLISTTLYVVSRPHRLSWPRGFSALRGALTFGWQVVLTRITWYVYSNADFAVVGRVLGKALLGAYQFGWTIASIPVDKISGILGRVTVPVFAAVQHDRPAVARYLLLLSEGLGFAVLPASIGMTLVAPDFVRVVLGHRWEAAIVPLAVLSAHVTMRCISAVFAQCLLAIGEARQSVRLGFVQVAVMPVLFYVAARRWGINGVAFAWLIVHPLIMVPMLILYTLSLVETPPTALLKVLWPAASGTAIMAGAVLALAAVMHSAPAPLRLGATVILGGVTYGAKLLVFDRPRMRELAAALRALRR